MELSSRKHNEQFYIRTLKFAISEEIIIIIIWSAMVIDYCFDISIILWLIDYNLTIVQKSKQIENWYSD